MSTSRGSSNRKRPQKHQNKTAFKNDLHDTSHKTKLLNSLEISGVCKRCKEIIEWKIKYKKYKPLTAPRKCVDCEQKAIKHAYHMLCSKCAAAKNVCAKCCKPKEDELDVAETPQKLDVDLQAMLKGLPERKRRTILRHINKEQDGEQKLTPEMMAQIEEILSKTNKLDLGDDDLDFLSDEFSDDDSDD